MFTLNYVNRLCWPICACFCFLKIFQTLWYELLKKYPVVLFGVLIRLLHKWKHWLQVRKPKVKANANLAQCKKSIRQHPLTLSC